MSPARVLVATRPIQHFWIGGVGALMPIFANLLIVDFPNQVLSIPPGVLLGWFLKAVFSFTIGGAIVYFLYSDETSPAKLFHAGIAAPALVVALMNGQQAQHATPLDSARQAGPVSPAHSRVLPRAISWPSWTVYAAGSALKTFALPRESFTSQVYRGITGASPQDIYFVIAGEYKTQGEAQASLAPVRRTFPSAEIYAPSGGNSYFSIVIGDHMTNPAALSLARKALTEGLTQTRVWRLGDPAAPVKSAK